MVSITPVDTGTFAFALLSTASGHTVRTLDVKDYSHNRCKNGCETVDVKNTFSSVFKL